MNTRIEEDAKSDYSFKIKLVNTRENAVSRHPSQVKSVNPKDDEDEVSEDSSFDPNWKKKAPSKARSMSKGKASQKKVKQKKLRAAESMSRSVSKKSKVVKQISERSVSKMGKLNLIN